MWRMSRLQVAIGVGSAMIWLVPGALKAAIGPAQAAAQVDRLLKTDLAAGETKSADSKATNSEYAKPASEKSDKVAASAKAANSASASLAKSADDETFLRRASMDLIGQPPSPAEITKFVLDPSADKRAKLVDRLLASPQFGENWGRYWRDVIMYRRSEDRSLLASPALNEYLTEQFNKDTPWDKVATAFITATGDVRENGAAGLIAAQFGQTPEVTAEVSRIFMGIEIQCANCHNHPTDRWKRTQFHELAAFFPRIGMQLGQQRPSRPAIVRGDWPRSAASQTAEPEPPTRRTRALHARSQESDRKGDADAAGVLPHRAEAPRRNARR